MSPPNTIAVQLSKATFFLGPGQFTFSIPVAGSIWSYTDEPGAAGYGVLNSFQAAAFVAAIEAWDRLIAPNFTRTDDLTQQGNIRIAFTDFTDIKDAWGYAFPPAVLGLPGLSANPPVAADIWINATEKGATFTLGDFDFGALLHEIGHTLGLSHPHDVATFPDEWDSDQWTVMSYESDRGVVEWKFIVTAQGLGAFPFTVWPETPMVLDIQAVQQRYGADTTTATGNDTYTFTPGKIFLKTIYDAGGIDTIDLNNITRDSVVDLRPGGYSSIGIWTIADQIAHWQAQFPNSAAFIASVLNNPANDPYTFQDNLGIAFSTTIENFRGGSGADTVTGNAVANNLMGMAGNDTMFGGGGDDHLVGGAGFDILFGDAGDDTATFDFIFADGGVVPFGPCILIGGEGIDFVGDMEVLIFKDGTIDRRDNDILVDDLYYYGVYHDVWTNKIDADSHYKTSGWKEGRNPNQFFDTKAYLAAYADARDAAAQGMDPMTHYLTIGWKKGYDPSGLFDTSAYLAAYSDVVAAGVNPLVHYLTTGIEEFRNTFGDGVIDP